MSYTIKKKSLFIWKANLSGCLLFDLEIPPHSPSVGIVFSPHPIATSSISSVWCYLLNTLKNTSSCLSSILQLLLQFRPSPSLVDNHFQRVFPVIKLTRPCLYRTLFSGSLTPTAAVLSPECTSAPSLKNKQHSQDLFSGAWIWTP